MRVPPLPPQPLTRTRGGAVIESKVCAKCGVDRPFADYYKMRRGKHGLNSWCKACMRGAKKRWRAKNIERARETDNAYRARTRERAWESKLKSQFGLTPEEYEALGPCGICGSTDDLVVDHDHACCRRTRTDRQKTCGRCVRGRLCRKCNLALGHFDDDIPRLRAAITYPEGSRNK